MLVPFPIVKSDCWAKSFPPLTPIIFQNTSNQNFEISILFSIVRKSNNYVSERNPPPLATVRVRNVSNNNCPLLICKVHMERGVCLNFGGGSLDWESEVPLHFGSKLLLGQLTPYPRPLFPNDTRWEFLDFKFVLSSLMDRVARPSKWKQPFRTWM